jgi:hypothetical protein
MQQQLEDNKRETEALNAALAAHLANPFPMIPQEYILNELEEPIQMSIRQHIQPLLNDLRSNVEALVQTQNQQLYGSLWAKVKITLRMVDAIARKVSKEQSEVS